MRVSVALATHNGAAFLHDQISSILTQSRPPDEIVLSDDASSDATVDISRSVLREAAAELGIDLVEIVNSVALGVTANFQSALQACTGEIVFLCDQDDVWHTGRVAQALSVFDSDPSASLVVCDARLIDSSGHLLGDTLFGALGLTPGEHQALAGHATFAALMRRNLVTGATTAVRRRLVEAAAPFPSAWVHDEWLAVVSSAEDGVRMIPSALVDYRQHGANQIGVQRTGLLEKFARITAERAERNTRLLARSEALVARFGAPQSGLKTEIVAAVQAKHEHERARSSLPRRRLARVVPLVLEIASGRYRTSGCGAQDILRDLLQPAGEHTSS